MARRRLTETGGGMSTGLLVETRRYVGPLDNHSHSYFQLVLPFDGRKEVEIEGRGD
jgi:hypothetical protein